MARIARQPECSDARDFRPQPARIPALRWTGAKSSETPERVTCVRIAASGKCRVMAVAVASLMAAIAVDRRKARLMPPAKNALRTGCSRPGEHHSGCSSHIRSWIVVTVGIVSPAGRILAGAWNRSISSRSTRPGMNHIVPGPFAGAVTFKQVTLASLRSGWGAAALVRNVNSRSGACGGQVGGQRQNHLANAARPPVQITAIDQNSRHLFWLKTTVGARPTVPCIGQTACRIHLQKQKMAPYSSACPV